ncbi:MAG: TetR family transcriptional regulator [Phenylobacterium sp.]|nr:TetR family transcriptional regulator [Phenylobacterium sp.]
MLNARLAESIINENLVYSSPKIFERRRRILQTTRDLIARQGYDGFSIKELCHAAKVSPQTIYKAFDSKERLVALSIRHYFLTFIETQHFHNDKATLQGVIERLVVSDSHMRHSREFATAIVAIYFSPTADEDLRVAAELNILVTLQPWVLGLRERGHLRVGVSLEPFLIAIVGLLFNLSLEWCRDNISNEEFLLRKLEALLTYASGGTRGAGRKEIDLYLTDLLGRRELISVIEAQAVGSSANAKDARAHGAVA